MGKKPAKPKEDKATPERLAVTLNSIDLQVDNHRSGMDQQKLEELSKSMQEVGLLNAIGVCKRARRYVLIYGHRRLEAAKLLKWKCISVDVYRDLTDLQIAEMQFIENLQREDLSPIDEARGIKALFDAGLSIDTIASRIDRSGGFVRARLDLLRLHKDIQPLVASGRIPLAHARLIARIGDQSIQEEVAYDVTAGEKDGDHVITLGDLRRTITWKLQTLGARGWPMDREYASKRACQGCVDNTTTEPGLFDGINLPGKSTKGNCTNKTCFEAKARAWEKDPVRLKRVKQREAKKKKAGDQGKTKDSKSPQDKKLETKRKAFPSTEQEIFAVELWQYGKKLADSILEFIKIGPLPPDHAACIISLAGAGCVGPCSCGEFGSDKFDSPQNLLITFNSPESVKLARDLLVDVFEVGVVDEWGNTEPLWLNWQDKPRGVPLSKEVVALIDCFEALAKRWKLLCLPTRPKAPPKKKTKSTKKTKKAKKSKPKGK